MPSLIFKIHFKRRNGEYSILLIPKMSRDTTIQGEYEDKTQIIARSGFILDLTKFKNLIQSSIQKWIGNKDGWENGMLAPTEFV